jgi:hypothetical protein
MCWLLGLKMINIFEKDEKYKNLFSDFVHFFNSF